MTPPVLKATAEPGVALPDPFEETLGG
jgi:hypothetical protein